MSNYEDMKLWAPMFSDEAMHRSLHMYDRVARSNGVNYYRYNYDRPYRTPQQVKNRRRWTLASGTLIALVGVLAAL